MPSGDRTGPWGRGAGTGRGLGYCSGYPGPGYMAPGPGFGFGGGYGLGRGRAFGRGFGRGLRGMWPGRWGYPGYAAGPYPYSYEEPPYSPYQAGYGRPYPQEEGQMNPEEEAAILARQAEDLEADLQNIRKRLEELQKPGKTKQKKDK